jgi:hybrid cluster-associated redox disulfide protein
MENSGTQLIAPLFFCISVLNFINNTDIIILVKSGGYFMYQVTKETIIADIMKNAPYTMPLFQGIGMHCMGCAMASGENVEQACAAHGVDADEFIERLNKFIAENA